MQIPGGPGPVVSVLLAAAAVSVLVLRGSFGPVEYVLLALSAIFAAYVVSGLLAHPDWGTTARGLVVPDLPLTHAAVLATVATVGTTLAPWGLSFIPSYALDKRLSVKDLRYERVDGVGGAVLPASSACSSSSPARRRCTSTASTSMTRRTPPARFARWPAMPRKRCSAWALSARGCSPPRSCRCRRRCPGGARPRSLNPMPAHPIARTAGRSPTA